MSQLDKAILDALAHVTFPKDFAQAKPIWVVTVDSVDYPLWETDALVVGSDAAGLRVAVELKCRQQNALVATTELYTGMSAYSGPDKQTLFTAATASSGDNFARLVEALASGEAVNHDIVYAEAVGSLHTLGGLRYLGLELPEDRYGAIPRYQVGHDKIGRATSCGPCTSRLMARVLLEEVQHLAILMLTSATVIELLHQRNENGKSHVAGVIITTDHRVHNPQRLATVAVPNVVLAAGGPGELCRDSVYLHKCFGSPEPALGESLTLINLTESRFGVDTPHNASPWNLSDTYVQVIPYIYSMDAGGNEYNSLVDYYRTTQELVSNVFHRGYQWPLHVTRVMDFGPNLLDMVVTQEQQSGRLVFMDFSRNPEPMPSDPPFSSDRLNDDVRAYLENNDVLVPSSIEHLRQISPLSIPLYKMYGYDPTTQPLQSVMNNQHMNDGIEVGIWGQTSPPGCFVVEEIAGACGVTRPGDAALDTRQVFTVRLVRFIGCTQRRDIDGDVAQLTVPAPASIRETITQAHDNGSGMPLSAVREKIQTRMLDYAGFTRHAGKVRRVVRNTLLLNGFAQWHRLTIRYVGKVAGLFIWRHMVLASAVVLTQLTHHIDAGGDSYGARMVVDSQSKCLPQTCRGVKEEWRLRSELAEDENHKLTTQYSQGSSITEIKPLCMQPYINSIYFEKSWPDLLKGGIYTQ